MQACSGQDLEPKWLRNWDPMTWLGNVIVVAHAKISKLTVVNMSESNETKTNGLAWNSRESQYIDRRVQYIRCVVLLCLNKFGILTPGIQKTCYAAFVRDISFVDVFLWGVLWCGSMYLGALGKCVTLRTTREWGGKLDWRLCPKLVWIRVSIPTTMMKHVTNWQLSSDL